MFRLAFLLTFGYKLVTGGLPGFHSAFQVEDLCVAKAYEGLTGLATHRAGLAGKHDFRGLVLWEQGYVLLYLIERYAQVGPGELPFVWGMHVNENEVLIVQEGLQLNRLKIGVSSARRLNSYAPSMCRVAGSGGNRRAARIGGAAASQSHEADTN